MDCLILAQYRSGTEHILVQTTVTQTVNKKIYFGSMCHQNIAFAAVTN